MGCQNFGVADVLDGFPDTSFGLWVAAFVVEAGAVELPLAAVIAAQETFRGRLPVNKRVQLVSGARGRHRLFAGADQDEGVGGPLGGAPGFLRRVADIAPVKAERWPGLACRGRRRKARSRGLELKRWSRVSSSQEL